MSRSRIVVVADGKEEYAYGIQLAVVYYPADCEIIHKTPRAKDAVDRAFVAAAKTLNVYAAAHLHAPGCQRLLAPTSVI